MPAHTTVSYAEPNLMVGRFNGSSQNIDEKYVNENWALNDGYERAPRLEDYCIGLNLEVEITSRSKQGTSDVIILQWSSDNKEGISFMGGTKIGGYEIHGTDRKAKLTSHEYLTTYYADMYVDDLIDYGTTEMIGIKSVNIEYAKSCVPVISIKFTDVRGISLFQPTELSRNNSYDGIKGLNRDNVAQSFFQCFFKIPLPKFTIYIKGFYGKPVAYVMMCDKFETNFNSETGDYDIDTRFIGYSYSFMTDISFDALLASPYSDFKGKKYWEDQVNNGRFFIWDKLKTKKMPMPTLYEIHKDFKSLVASSESSMLETTLSSEEMTHEEEIEKLSDIQEKYRKWYSELFNLLKEKFGKRYCFDFRDDRSEDSDWIKIMVLTNDSTSNVKDLSEAYTQFADSFKTTNNDLYASIEEFNNSGNNYKTLQNISKDFSKYTRISLFNDCYVNSNTRKIEFGGFSRDFNGNRTLIVDRMFYGENTTLNNVSKDLSQEQQRKYKEEINKYKGALKDFTLSSIYGDGTNQYKDAFVIEVDYSDISRRIKALNLDATRSTEQKEKIKRRKEHNRLMMSKMNWYPSVENFMKIMMAHVETYMHMMYQVKTECSNRTPNELGITIGKDGNACDVNPAEEYVPPFPRVVKTEIGDDNITKVVDEWVGNFEGEKRFIEADLIDGLFNAIDVLQELYKADTDALNNQNSQEEVPKLVVKHPLTSFDFFLTKNPYGNDNDLANNPNAFAGKVATRMFNILSLNNFKKEYGEKWSFSNPEFLEKLGEIEAENFNDNVKITNQNMLSMLGANGGGGTITPKSIIDCVVNGIPIGDIKDIPWKNSDKKNIENLFNKSMFFSRYETSYSQNDSTRIFPIQNMSFKELDETLKKFNKGVNSIDINNDDITIDWASPKYDGYKLLSIKDKTNFFGTTYINNDYKYVSNILENSCSSANNLYSDIYNLIHENSVLNKEKFGNIILQNGVFVPKQNVLTAKKAYKTKFKENLECLTINVNENTNEINGRGSKQLSYSFNGEKLENLGNEIENKSIESWFLNECRGYSKDNGVFSISLNDSLLAMKDYKDGIHGASWAYGGYQDKRIGFILMGFECINYEAVKELLANNNTFAYLPKLAVLQIGAALASAGCDVKITSNMLSRKVMLPRTFDNIIDYLNTISYMTKISYIRYFRDWVFKHQNILSKENENVAVEYVEDMNTEEANTRRTLFREDSDETKVITNGLMIPIVIAKGCATHYKGGLKTNNISFSQSNAVSFLTGFLRHLKELYKIPSDNTSRQVKLTKEPSKTTEDMKKELYRYMKLVYEKWVPAMEEKEWQFETFFDEKKEMEIRNGFSGGHLFHFIDSFYNKIGDKLLINPTSLTQMIDDALNAKNVNTMMLGFVADVLSKNKTMLMCLQNFQDLAKKDAMDMMFRPLPYNAIKGANKHPDFVIIYPYEPSKYLNVDNGEFNDDSFMLNDEFSTPLGIKSRDENNCYKIPAFGVNYGKQYQNYFKKINVGMQSTIATQQALMVKHAILRKSVDSNTQTTVAQDLYDVYTTQSYTCKVEMMGCAWVQPLMYFVLTNVPMFRGSYLIFKVTHNITPGNMTTEFQGTRMANVSNKLVDEIFTDEELDEIYGEEYVSDRRHALANIDNDCPYKVYPLFESDMEISKDEDENAKKAMSYLINKHGFKDVAAAGICGNIFKESTWNLWAKNGIGAFGLCQWTSVGKRKEKLIGEYGDKPSFENQMDYIAWEWEGGDVTAHSKLGLLQSATTPKDAADIVCEWFERPGKNKPDYPTRENRAARYFENYYKTEIKNEQKPNNKDIRDGLFNAVKKSLESINSSTDIVKKNINENTFTIEANGKNNLDLVFDILLNGYYDYVERLDWVVDQKDLLGKPIHIQVTAKEKVEPNNRHVWAYRKGDSSYGDKKYGSNSSQLNKSLLKSLYKRYKGNPINPSEIAQFDNMDIFKEVSSEIQNCDSLMESTTNIVDNVKCNVSNGKIGDWNVKMAVDYLWKYSRDSYDDKVCKKGAPIIDGSCIGRCWGYVKRALAYSGFKTDGSVSAYMAINFLSKNGFKKIREGIVEGHKGSDYDDKCVGDITVFDKCSGHEHGHINMWCGSQWISDFKQNGNWIDNKAKTKFTVWRYSGSGGFFNS